MDEWRAGVRERGAQPVPPRLSWDKGDDAGLDLAAEQAALFAFVRVCASAAGLHVGYPLDAIAFAVLRAAGREPTADDARDLVAMHAFEQGTADRTPHGGG